MNSKKNTSQVDRQPEAQDRPGDAAVRPATGRDLSPRGRLAQPGLSVAQATVGFGPKPKNGADPRIEKLASENTRMKNVIAEITGKNLELKKTLSD